MLEHFYGLFESNEFGRLSFNFFIGLKAEKDKKSIRYSDALLILALNVVF